MFVCNPGLLVRHSTHDRNSTSPVNRNGGIIDKGKEPIRPRRETGRQTYPERHQTYTREMF